MATETSNIDDLLMSQGTVSSTQPASPESEAMEEIVDAKLPTLEEDIAEPATIEASTEEPIEEAKIEEEHDEYGNERQATKLYTEDEVSERINQAMRERVARFERNSGQQIPQQQVQQGFEYNAESTESWQQQLESLIEQTYYKIDQKQAHQQQQVREQQVEAEHAQRMQQGAAKFSDFRSVVRLDSITDAMTLATRSMKDPAAFIYAASKRAPQELQRISQMPDPYAQMVEMGKLEERMKQSKQPASKAPKPVGRTQEDLTISHKSDKEPTIEDLIARADAKKVAKFNQRRGK